jgi:hypothetical protein
MKPKTKFINHNPIFKRNNHDNKVKSYFKVNYSFDYIANSINRTNKYNNLQKHYKTIKIYEDKRNLNQINKMFFYNRNPIRNLRK